MRGRSSNGRLCVVCGDAFRGVVDGVPLSICCKNCCLRRHVPEFLNSDFVFLVSKNKAIKRLRCGHNNLRALNSRDVEYEDGAGNVAVMRLYVYAEVLQAKHFRGKRLREEIRRRRKDALVARRLQLEHTLRTSLTRMDPIVRHFLCGDYFGPQPRTTLYDIQTRFAVLGQVRQILTCCHRAHPEAAFEFCVQNPYCGVREFEELRNKLRTVFRLEGTRILHHIPQAELPSLSMTVLKDVYEEFAARDVAAILQGHLIRLVGRHTADQILTADACQERIKRGGDEAKLAKRLADFWLERNDEKKRRARLEAALRERDLAQELNLAMCEAYVFGEIDCDIEEVVAITEIFHELAVSSGVCPHSFRGAIAQSTFQRCYYDLGMDYNTSVEYAIEDAVDFNSTTDSVELSEADSFEVLDLDFGGPPTEYFSDEDYLDDIVLFY